MIPCRADTLVRRFCPFERISNLKTNVVVLHPGAHLRIAIQLKRFIRFPTAVINGQRKRTTQTHMLMWSAGRPRPALKSKYARSGCPILARLFAQGWAPTEDRFQGESVFKTNRFNSVLPVAGGGKPRARRSYRYCQCSAPISQLQCRSGTT